ncbi:MAG: hypothetical protein K2N36_01480 [Ruminiclostridium sp.]|nr:hypothetical protein [Ruminiclostridium sp.]
MKKNTLLDRINGKAGHRGIQFFLYLAFFAIHTVISASVYLPSIEPNEFSAAALANMMLGGDWSAAMGKSSYFYGFLQAVLYIPSMAFTKDPFVQYRIMVIINGAVMSLIPVIVYSCSIMLGVKKPWQSVIMSVCAGGWLSCMIHSKFIWNETVAIFIPFLAVYLLLKAETAEKKSTGRLYSALLGMTAGLSYCAHQRLFALILALSAALILSRFVLKRKTAALGCYFFSLIVFFGAAFFGNYYIQQILWGVSDPASLRNTAESFFASLPSALSNGGGKRFFISLLSQIYYYMCASWGLGALAFSILVIIIAQLITARIKRKKNENEKKSEEEPKPIFGGVRTVFLFFTALLTVFMLFIGVCYRFGAENFSSSQSAILFGRYLDSVIPLTIMLILTFIYTEELQKTQIYGGVITLGVTYTLFFIIGRGSVLGAESASISPILCIYPVMFGESTSSLVTSTGLIAAVSCSLCIMALLLVIVSCSARRKNAIISSVVLMFTLYSVVFGSLYYLPLSRGESVSKNEEYVQLSSYIFNSSEAPALSAYRCSRSCVMTVQYLNQNVSMYTAETVSELKEDTFVIMPSDAQISFEGVQGRPVFELLGETDNYRIYAYGERAKAYAQAQSGNNEEEEQEISQSEAADDPFPENGSEALTGTNADMIANDADGTGNFSQ